MTAARKLAEAVNEYLTEWNRRGGEFRDDCVCLDFMRQRLALAAAFSAYESSEAGGEHGPVATDECEWHTVSKSLSNALRSADESAEVLRARVQDRDDEIALLLACKSDKYQNGYSAASRKHAAEFRWFANERERLKALIAPVERIES